LVEENFSPSLKIEWPDYVKATRVLEYQEQGYSVDELAKMFKWPKSKIKETLKIQEIIHDFETFAISEPDQEDEYGGGLGMTENDAQVMASKNYQYFNEAQKSFYKPLQTDFDFKIQFFKWIADNKFSSFAEVRTAYNAWNHPEAKAALMQPEPTAAKSAKAILDYNSRVVKNKEEISGRIESFVKFLTDITVEQFGLIPAVTRKHLEEALELVVKMGRGATSED